MAIFIKSPCGMKIPSDIFGRWLTPPTNSVSLCFLVLGQCFPNLHDWCSKRTHSLTIFDQVCKHAWIWRFPIHGGTPKSSQSLDHYLKYWNTWWLVDPLILGNLYLNWTKKSILFAMALTCSCNPLWSTRLPPKPGRRHWNDGNWSGVTIPTWADFKSVIFLRIYPGKKSMHSKSQQYLSTGWWFGTFLFFHIFGMSSSQLTKSYFSEGYTTNQLMFVE